MKGRARDTRECWVQITLPQLHAATISQRWNKIWHSTSGPEYRLRLDVKRNRYCGSELLKYLRKALPPGLARKVLIFPSSSKAASDLTSKGTTGTSLPTRDSGCR
jgi:hypothetical protein